MSEYARDRAWVHGVLGGKCVVCGRYDYRAMEVDHIDAAKNPVKGAYLMPQWTRGIHHALKLLKEGEDITGRFQLLCAWCHAIKTKEEIQAAKRCQFQLEFQLGQVSPQLAFKLEQ